MATHHIKSSALKEVVAEITGADFDRLSRLREAAITLAELEKIYSISVRSYIEFESFLLETALSYSMNTTPLMFSDGTMEEWLEDCNLKILNILNAHSAYLDHLPQRIETFNAYCPNIVEQMKAKCSEVFDKSQEYRIVMTLRNIAQHSQLPIRGQYFSIHSGYEDKFSKYDTPSNLRITIDPYFVSKRIVASKKGRAKTREEVEALGFEMLDAKMVIRLFVQAFHEIHKELRILTDEIIKQIDEGFKEVYAYQKLADANKQVSLCLTSDEGIEFFMGRDFPTATIKKRQQWSSLQNLAKRYVSSQPSKRRDTYYGSDPQIWID